ncbi:hypothetical protein RSOLAG1IB_11455 [Rhizoctonia solani AG-1 IB]|uniref:Uncharacterized protein n=1 Tax=Thanatephorus cucumeris (strain AG1-IB / isolate 7/3/14) TaxID=1108050 RepID=A0A0B7F9Y7_THACB|nr:hypothetical protein RSOLAG1IB_11455 [Rhizoctonia solani AG-1 IB]
MSGIESRLSLVKKSTTLRDVSTETRLGSGMAPFSQLCSGSRRMGDWVKPEINANHRQWPSKRNHIRQR